MRPPAIEKMGYYPTDLPVVELIASALNVTENENIRILDPCAGEGIAVERLASDLGRETCEIWGAELSYIRAEEAKVRIDRLCDTAWQRCLLTDESISLLFLNPPYDDDRLEGGARLEFGFLKSCTEKLVPNGILVFIVPMYSLQNDGMAKYLLTHYDDVAIYRFPDHLFDKFKQVVVFGRRRICGVLANDDAVSFFKKQVMACDELKKFNHPVYQIPVVPQRGKAGKAIQFKRLDWDPEETAEAVIKSGVQILTSWNDLIHPDHLLAQFSRPVMPLKKGHIAMLMASGMMGTVRLNDENGKPMLIKGRVVKEVEKTVLPDPNDPDTEIVKFKDRFVTTISLLRQSGIQMIRDVQQLSDFMRKYGDAIAQHVMTTYDPLYQMDPTESEGAILDHLGKERKCLPGQETPGLLPAQRHVAAALTRSIRKQGVANLQGEMGVGKTSIATAVMELQGQYPAIVICPPHLVPKWCREIEEIIPGAHTMELCRIGRNADDDQDLNDVRQFLAGYDAACQEWKAGKSKEAPRWVAVVSNTSAKMGSGWQPSYQTKVTKHPMTGINVHALTCPSCGSVLKKVISGMEIPITDPEELNRKRMFCNNRVSGWEMDAKGRKITDEEGKPVWGTHKCNEPLFQFNVKRRFPIAEYILKQCKNQFKLLITDEVHQYKSKSSDRGVAFHHLVRATGKTLTLTGTFFGGKSTSIFWLLYRLSAKVRNDFQFNEESRWAALYGVLETTKKINREEDDGVYTGNRRYANQAKEQPGISPEVINRLLDTSVFLSLKDLGLGLPDYKEEVVVTNMLDEQSLQYNQMENTLSTLAKQSNSYLSSWLQWSLARPNSAFRDEIVYINDLNLAGESVQKVPLMELPTVIDVKSWLPKEDWLSSYCQSEKRAGRKTLVYLRQTGTRDIQDRILASLQNKGLRGTILSSSTNPRSREAWIEKQAVNLDVLICNPKLVETGLDLVMFSTAIFYEIEYSLYTLWQAVRRVWRLGQTKPVKVLFSVYDQTMEARALSLIGRKMKAAQLLYGDEVGGAIVPQEDGDFLTQLARDVLDENAIVDLHSLFADDHTISHSAVGSLITPSAPVIQLTLENWQTWANQHQVQIGRQRRKNAEIPQEQMSLF